MQPLNRYSLWLGMVLAGLLGGLLAVLRRPVLGGLVAFTGIAALTAMWRALRTGPSTLGSLASLESAIGSGKPLLIELYSDT